MNATATRSHEAFCFVPDQHGNTWAADLVEVHEYWANGAVIASVVMASDPTPRRVMVWRETVHVL